MQKFTIFNFISSVFASESINYGLSFSTVAMINDQGYYPITRTFAESLPLKKLILLNLKEKNLALVS